MMQPLPPPTTAFEPPYVETGRAKQVFEHLDSLYEHGWKRLYCKVLFILGPPGTGKTYLVRRWQAKKLGLNPDDPPAQTRLLPIPWAEVILPATPRSVCASLKEALMFPNPSYGDADEAQRQIHSLIETAKDENGARLVRTLILDEGHRPIGGIETNRARREVGVLLTSFVNRRLCPLAVVSEPEFEQLFNATNAGQARGNTQLEGRSAGSLVIGPYRWALEADRDEFRTFLHMVDKALPLPELSNLSKVEFALPIHNYSGGILRSAVNLIETGLYLAQRANRPCISRELFKEAVDRLRIGATNQLLNPFRIDDVPSGDPR